MRESTLAFIVIVSLLCIILGIQLTQIAHAQTTVSLTIPCSNENWLHSPDCQAEPVPETMIINPYGVSSGELVNGKRWTQERITKDIAIFRLDDVCQVVTGYGTWDC